MTNSVRIEVVGHLGHITLTRPQKLNALTHEMIGRIATALKEWQQLQGITSILIDADEERAFCAGGDIESTYGWTFGEQTAAYEYWRDEHALVLLIASYEKPVITILNGFVLGGGVGIACHASHRLATPNVKVGMPEVAIGLAPDVGGLHILGHVNDNVGIYFALTAQYMGPVDALNYGFADAIVDWGCRNILVRTLARYRATEDIAPIIGSVALPSEAVRLMRNKSFIDRDVVRLCFGRPTVEEILTLLDSQVGAFAKETASRLRAMSPVALKVTLRAIQNIVKGSSLAQTLEEDVRRNVHFSFGHDLREGIRAAVIDKDHNPSWEPTSLSEVTDAMVGTYFKSIDYPDLSPSAIVKHLI